MGQPAQIGRYQVVGHLATGGMAEILLGKVHGPSGFERPVVIKRILPNLVKQQSFVDMFLDEAKVVARIQHPNVVHVHELGREEGELYLVMEYLEGETVLNLLRRSKRVGKPLHPALAGHIVAKAAAGLHAAHDLKDESGELVRLVHRDVSPHNIFVTYTGDVKVLDFGIAKHDERSTNTEAGQLKGKFPYMSPEQCLGKDVDRRSDIFSLGIVLFELLTGKRLFARDTSLMTMQAIVNGEASSPRRYNPECPESLAQVCMKALKTDPAHRYQTAADMRRDIVAAVRKMSFEDIPEEALGMQMQDIFHDRYEEKVELLRRVGSGSQITNVPMAEVDISVSLPGVASQNAKVDPTTPFSVQSKARGRDGWPVAWTVAVAAAVLLGVGVGLGVAFGGGSDGTAPVAAAPAPETTPVEPPSVEPAAEIPPEATEDPIAPTEVTLSVISTPTGALVTIEGEERGETPLDVTLPIGEAPVAVRIGHDGYAPATQRFVPDGDGRIDAVLEALAVPTPRESRPRSSMSTRMRTMRAAPMGGDSPFRRFN